MLLEKSVQAELIETLAKRFQRNIVERNYSFESVIKYILKDPDNLVSLWQMERTGGEPDVLMYDEKSDEYVFFDTSAETPGLRRNVCYDKEARIARKKFPPESSVMELVSAWNVDLLNEADYRFLQSLGTFDTKTSSWLKTPASILKRGGAIFGDCRYGHVFIYHNSADSYYGSRGFRVLKRV